MLQLFELNNNFVCTPSQAVPCPVSEIYLVRDPNQKCAPIPTLGPGCKVQGMQGRGEAGGEGRPERMEGKRAGPRSGEPGIRDAP